MSTTSAGKKLTGSDHKHVRNLKETAFMNSLLSMLPTGSSYTRAWREFKVAVEKYVNTRFGVDGFDLTFPEVWARLCKTKFRCEYSGDYLQIISGLAVDGGNPYKLSIDKFDRSIDTYRDNFRVSTHADNRAKNCQTGEQYVDRCVRVALHSGKVILKAA